MRLSAEARRPICGPGDGGRAGLSSSRSPYEQRLLHRTRHATIHAGESQVKEPVEGDFNGCRYVSTAFMPLPRIDGMKAVMKNVNPLALPESFFSQLTEGAFLTVRAGASLNTMTIGWGMIGVVWERPIFTVLVRDSRHTYSIMEQAVDFTVTVPTEDMNDALAFCGTRSGRDLDKFEACGLKTKPGLRTASPVLDVRGVQLECRILYKTPMDPSRLDPALGALYPKHDYHTLYFGEILECYE